MPYKIANHVGKRFGRLVAIRRITRKESPFDKTAYECLCDCGKTCIVRSYGLVTHNTKSCGCLNVDKRRHTRCVDLTGKKVGRLLVV